MVGRTDNMLKNYFYSTLRRMIRRIAKIAKIPKSKIMRTCASDINIEYIHKLIKDYNVDISIIDNDEVKKRILMLEGSYHLEGKPIELSHIDPINIRNLNFDARIDNNIIQNAISVNPISAATSKATVIESTNLITQSKNQNDRNDKIETSIILNERKKIFSISKSIKQITPKNSDILIPNEKLLQPQSCFIK